MREKRYFVKVKQYNGEGFRSSWSAVVSFDTFGKAEEEACRLRSLHPDAKFRVVFCCR